MSCCVAARAWACGMKQTVGVNMSIGCMGMGHTGMGRKDISMGMSAMLMRSGSSCDHSQRT